MVLQFAIFFKYIEYIDYTLKKNKFRDNKMSQLANKRHMAYNSKPDIDKKDIVKPILKWAGGKTQLLPEIIKRMPHRYNKYIEPFFGGGALFFYAQPHNAILADINPELVNLYTMVKHKPYEIIELLKKFRNTEEDYYNIRSQDRLSLSLEMQAARTLYLNKTCFNGLYRVNKKGEFNTPYGKYKNPNFIGCICSSSRYYY